MLRLTKKCNAQCSYCSTDIADATCMSISDLKSCLDGVKDYLVGLGYQLDSTNITICLLGGELSTLSLKYLQNVKNELLAFFEEANSIIVGLQTNLIMSKAKLIAVYRMFDGNVGTSIDNFSDSRRFKGSAELYRATVRKNLDTLRTGFDAKIGACYVTSVGTEDFVKLEVKKANDESYPIKLILARKSHLGEVAECFNDIDNIVEVYLELLNEWFMRSEVAIDPFLYMLNRKLGLITGSNTSCFESCNFTNRCHDKGLCIEPNGDYYFCQELADLKALRIGNLLDGSFDKNVISLSHFREASIASVCSLCPHYKSCKGGCLAYSINENLGVAAKDPYCKLHYELFSRLDELINKYKINDIIKWKETLN